MNNLKANDSLIAFLLSLADNALILGHRNSEWTGHGPILEQDIAISNIALDLVGQSRNFYQYAAQKINKEEKSALAFGRVAGRISEDSLAYTRDGWDFKNCLLVEQTNGDWAKTILRQFLFSNFQFLLYESLKSSKDSQIAAISEKSLKEVTYHLRWSSEWVIRLGDGTAESHRRMLIAYDELWTYTGELFEPADYEKATALSGLGTDITLLQNRWEKYTANIFDQATLPKPSPLTIRHGMKNGKEGRHTEHLGYILTEMQFLQRAYPGCEW